MQRRRYPCPSCSCSQLFYFEERKPPSRFPHSANKSPRLSQDERHPRALLSVAQPWRCDKEILRAE